MDYAMIEFFNPSNQMFLNGMNLIQAREQQAQQQLTTGLKISTVSDDPDHIANLMQVRTNLAQTQQIASNLGSVKTETDTAEGALSNAVKLLENVSTLASEGQPTTQTAVTRSQIAGGVDSALQQLVGTANTSVEGRFIFSGDSDQTQPYTIDQTGTVSAYAGSAATRQVQHPDGSLFPISKTAQDIFDSADPATNVFAVVAGLRTALLNNDQAGIDTAVSNLQGASTYLNNQLAFYGTVQNRVASGIDFAANLETQLKTQQSDIQDADLTLSITDLNQAATQQQAALAAEKEMPRTSLFDFLA
jgi:flagellar hook-associated protein 3 FlgL